MKQEDIDNITPEEFIIILHKFSPSLSTIERFNKKFLHDAQFGELTITEYVRNGKIYRIEVLPKISEIIQDDSLIDEKT